MWLENDTPYDFEPTLAYQSGIYTTTEQQYQEAYKFLTNLLYKSPNQKLFVDLQQATNGNFYQAEERHQDYIQKQIVTARKQFIKWANDEVPSSMFCIVE